MCPLILFDRVHFWSNRVEQGDQLVFNWDRLENFLITHDRPVSNKATNTNTKVELSHVQIQCTIALVSDAYVEGKGSVTPKS